MVTRKGPFTLLLTLLDHEFWICIVEKGSETK